MTLRTARITIAALSVVVGLIAACLMANQEAPRIARMVQLKQIENDIFSVAKRRGGDATLNRSNSQKGESSINAVVHQDLNPELDALIQKYTESADIKIGQDPSPASAQSGARRGIYIDIYVKDEWVSQAAAKWPRHPAALIVVLAATVFVAGVINLASSFALDTLTDNTEYRKWQREKEIKA